MDRCFVRSDVRPGLPLTEKRSHDCLWIRKRFLEAEDDDGTIVAHGHSISAPPVIGVICICINIGTKRSGILTSPVLMVATRGFL